MFDHLGVALDQPGLRELVPADRAERAGAERRRTAHEVRRRRRDGALRAIGSALEREAARTTIGLVYFDHERSRNRVAARREIRRRFERRDPEAIVDVVDAHTPRIGHQMAQRVVDRGVDVRDGVHEVDPEHELPERTVRARVRSLEVGDRHPFRRKSAVPVLGQLVREITVVGTACIAVHRDEERLLVLRARHPIPEDRRPPEVGPGHVSGARRPHLVVQRGQHLLGFVARDQPHATIVAGRSERDPRPFRRHPHAPRRDSHNRNGRR